MAEKKYYWLKLQKDFFKRHDIQIVESMPNGKDYILFYLKLLVESVSHYGHLRFSDTIPYTPEMLSTITNTNIDIVKSAIKLFTELNMVQILDDQTVFMAEVERMVGAETEWAEKKRLYRDKKGQCPQLVQAKSDKSKNKKLDIDIEKDNTYCAFFDSIWKLYPNKKGKGSVSLTQKKKLHAIGYDNIKKCIDRYKESKEEWKQWQHGSTFFNSGYVDYLDENYTEPEEGDMNGKIVDGKYIYI